MKVSVVFEFPSIKDVDGQEADEVMDYLSTMTKQMSTWFDGQANVYVDDATEEN